MSGTIVVFSEDPRLRERVCAVIPSLPAATDVLLAWEAFAVAAPASLCAIVCIEHLGPSGKYAELCGLKRMNPLLPIVLVTARTAENARWLKDGNVEEVVWSVELDVDLSPAVVAAVARSWRERAARAVEGAGHLSPRLRRAIAEAFRRPKPPRTVASLARLAGCDRRTLWQDWRQAGVPLTLQYLIEWRLLVAAPSTSVRARSGTALQRISALTPVRSRG